MGFKELYRGTVALQCQLFVAFVFTDNSIPVEKVQDIGCRIGLFQLVR